MKNKKEKNYKLRSKVYNGVGNSVFGLGVFGSFFGYEMATDWSNFKNELDDFVVINQETLKINLFIALPALIVLVIYIILWRKRNKKAIDESGNITFGILIALIFTYAIYSIIEVTMITLAGAFTGSLIDAYIFKPLSKSAKIKASDDKEISLEIRREKARKKAREDELSGIV